MKKLFLITTLFALIVSNNTAFAAFLDVPENHKNATAIEYLQENGVIQGYSDGTFKPNNTINRAEFLKIIIEGSDIPTDITNNAPFPDVQNDAWYGKYVKKAYHEGWIIGYTDGKFKPEREISKVEALKIIAKAQKWSVKNTVLNSPFEDVIASEWYAPYVEYAKEHQYLEETGSLYGPHIQANRGGISEVIYRTNVDFENQPPNNENTTPTNNTTETNQGSLNFQPYTVGKIPADFFNNITLSEDLPNTFYQGEVYILSGTITQSGYNSATAALYELSSTTPKTFIENTNGNSFSIPIYFATPGNHRIGLLPGESGSTKTANISVLPNLPKNTETEIANSATNIQIQFQNNKTNIKLNSENSTFKKIILTQNDQKVTYLNRQNINSLPIQFKDFQNFKNGNVQLTIETAKIGSTVPLSLTSNFASSSTVNFTATEHSFSIIEDKYIDSVIPETLSFGSTINFSGTVKRNTKTKAYVIKPDGFTETLTLKTTSQIGTYFDSNIILNGGNFTFTYVPQSSGTYIIEINDQDGLATVNHPIYIGNTVPLIPDYFDINKRTTLFNGDLDLNNEQQNLLTLINQSRQAQGLAPIILDNQLNNLAQNHSNDMHQNNYFGHYNLQNQTPDDRRIAAGITTSVGENVAKDVGIKFAHYGLMRSAAHRENILDENWTRVGIGITLSNGYLLIAEEFSSTPITSEDLTKYKNELLTKIGDLRTAASVSGLVIKDDLNLASKYLTDKVIIEKATINNALFNEALDTYGVTGLSQAIGRNHSQWKVILDSILNDEKALLTDPSNINIGVDIQVDEVGTIHALIILNKNN